ncbi:MAG: HlyD family secretion protein [Bacteroidales bacterium]|jgi:HlyD family secretion protein|nr:HlyD family secretion protein [Bacteroidales bacterium]
MLATDNISLRSESVKEILGKPPKWLVRWGITVILTVVVVLFVGSYFVKYPDIIRASITVTTENLPVGIVAKTSGRIDSIFVSEKQPVKQGDVLAVLENTADFETVMRLKQLLSMPSPVVENTNPSAIGYHPSGEFNSPFKNLGTLQNAYANYFKALADYNYFVETDYHYKKIESIKKQIDVQKSILQKSQNQLKISQKQLDIAKDVFKTDSALFAKNVISLSDFQTARNTFYQQQQSCEAAKLGIDNQKMGILQSEQTIFDLQQQCNEQTQQLELNLTNSLAQLQTDIKNWEQMYLFIAPTDGMATFTKYWQKNQNINAGETLLTIVPNEQAKIIGKILLPPQGAGKVKTGQTVNVKFDNFPYLEYGMLKVTINNISLVPVTTADNQKVYVLEVAFPENLTTNYSKTLEFSQEMTGTAEIITEDLRLLDRFINPMKALIKR